MNLPGHEEVGRATARFSIWRTLGMPVLVPTALAYASQGAAIVALTLTALDSGASPSRAALVGGTVGVGGLIGSVPAGRAVARYGDRAVLAVSLATTAALWACVVAVRSVELLACAGLLGGLLCSGFGVARQAYTIEWTPATHRGRAMSALGGAGRGGLVLGPLIVGALRTITDARASFVACGVLAGTAAVVVLLAVRSPRRSRAAEPAAGTGPGVAAVLSSNAVTLASVGSGVLLLAGARSLRSIIVPLAAVHAGFSSAAAATIVGLTAAVELALFYPAGVAMDRFGRRWVATSSLGTMAGALLVLAVAPGRAGVVLGGLVLACGSGFGAGIVKTLGADLAPPESRATFLGIWNLITEAGSTGGPLAVGALLAVAPLSAAVGVVGAACAVGTLWLDRAVKIRAPGA